MHFPFLQLAIVRGLVAGFALAAPMGPVAMLCVRRTLVKGRLQAFMAGLGAALADMLFGAAAGLGITAVNAFVFSHEDTIGLIGGAIVLVIGIATYRAPIKVANGGAEAQTLRRDFVASFTMAITNPTTMGAAAGLFAAFGPVNAKLNPGTAFWLVFGVLAGSALWWLTLVSIAGVMREGFLRHGLSKLNKISGAIITLSGVVVLAVTLARAVNAG
jgi:threonine/homoserine/homoserine lactone efflux protein